MDLHRFLLHLDKSVETSLLPFKNSLFPFNLNLFLIDLVWAQIVRVQVK